VLQAILGEDVGRGRVARRLQLRRQRPRCGHGWQRGLREAARGCARQRACGWSAMSPAVAAAAGVAAPLAAGAAGDGDAAPAARREGVRRRALARLAAEVGIGGGAAVGGRVGANISASALRALTVWFLSAIRDPPRGGGSFAGSMPTGLGGHREGRRASARASVAFCIGGRSFWLGCAGGSHASACASRFAPRLLDWSRPGVVTAGRTPLLGHV
jgi:hypothetical protein